MDSVSTLILVISLIVIMTGMGLSLTFADFKRVLEFPKAIFVGFLNQIILLPLVAYGLIKLYDVNDTIAMGVMILSACPGGPTSNLVTHLAKGDVALSVTLTAINSILTIISIPIIVNFAIVNFAVGSDIVESPVTDIIVVLLVVIALPLTIGMFLRKKKPELAQKMDKPVRIASMLIIVLVIVGIVIKERTQLVERVTESFSIVISLNIATMVIGFFTARLFRLNFRQSLTISLESGNQNGTLAIQISSLINLTFGFPAAVYSLFMYVTATLPIWIGNKRSKKDELKD